MQNMESANTKEEGNFRHFLRTKEGGFVVSFALSVILLLLSFSMSTSHETKVKVEEKKSDEIQKLMDYADKQDMKIIESVKVIIQTHQQQEFLYLQSMDKKIDKMDSKLDTWFYNKNKEGY